MQVWDSIVIGAGPAGLTAATYLARFRRSVVVLGSGAPRARWIPESHNTPGFPNGVGGPALLQRMTEQAVQFGARLETVEVRHIAPSDDLFQIEGHQGSMLGRTVLLATGVADRLPDVEGIEAAIQDSLVRMCPICDAFEAIDQRIAVLGEGEFARREAEFLSTYSTEVSILDPLETEFSFVGRRVEAVGADGQRRDFDHLYLALGFEPRSALATNLGAQQDETGKLLVDSHQMTSVDGLFAAGDVVRGLNQIAVATGEAAVAATAIHNRLRATGRPNGSADHS